LIKSSLDQFYRLEKKFEAHKILTTDTWVKKVTKKSYVRVRNYAFKQQNFPWKRIQGARPLAIRARTVWPIHYFYIKLRLVLVSGKIICTFSSGNHFKKSEKIKK
jgi:hypothetical protein